VKKKLFVVASVLLIVICFSVINNNIRDKSKIVNYEGNKLFVTVDEVSMDALPSSGNYYLTSYDCDNTNTKITWDRTNYKLVVSNGNDGGGVSCDLEFESNPLLSKMEVGSYVDYVGSSGTVGSTTVSCKNSTTGSSVDADDSEAPDSCHGQNAREDLDSSNFTYGYCSYDGNKFHTTGWRIAYVKDGKARLISAGAPECMSVTQSVANATYIKTANAKALKYCNSTYVDGSCTCTSTTSGQCDSASTDAWAVSDADFYYMTRAINNNVGKRLAEGSSLLGDVGGSLGETLYCDSGYSLKECGYNNDLIDNGGLYLFAAKYNDSEEGGMVWEPNYRVIMVDAWSSSVGFRPVINMSASVVVTGGSGTMDDPYTIYNKKEVADVESGSYVRWIGNNGCTGDYCSGAANANSSTTYPNGYCLNSSSEIYEYDSLGWEIAYSDGTNTYITSAGCPNCVATCNDGTLSSTPCTTSSETTTGTPKHFANTNTTSLLYCNAGFVEGGLCDSTTTWNIKESDFTAITGSAFSSCHSTSSAACGNASVLVNGGYYWFNTTYGSTYGVYQCGAKNKVVSNANAKYALGVRPILKLDSSVIIVSGTGTESDPYILANPDSIEDLSENMNNGALKGETWTKKDGIVTTDGVDDYINMGLKNYSFGSAVSFITRVKFNSLSSHSSLFGNWQSGGSGLILSNNETSGLGFLFNPYIEEASSYVYANYYSSSIVANRWYTVIGMYDGTTIKLYLDGSLVASTTSAGNIDTADVVTQNFVNATYDYALIYDRTLTADEISTNFANEELVDSNLDKTNLLAYYNFGK